MVKNDNLHHPTSALDEFNNLSQAPDIDPLVGKEEQALIELGLGVAFTLILLMILVGAVIIQLAPLVPESVKGIKKLGEIGDFLGGVLNPIVALLALLALLRSIRIQRDELRDTRETLADQGKIQDRERAEKTFFELLALRANAVATIEWTDQLGETKTGRGALKLILKEVVDLGKLHNEQAVKDDLEFWEVPSNLSPSVKPYVAVFAYRYTGIPNSAAMKADFSNYVDLPTYEPELGHVFRATYQILKFIHRQPQFSERQKEDLANYLRAQMSEDDFLLFGLTALTSIGKKSRAAAIGLDFYQKRLQSIPWAKDMLLLFSREDGRNINFAALEGFQPNHR